MAQDLRDLFKDEREKEYQLKAGHEDRFAALLDERLPQRVSVWQGRYWAAAAVVLLLVTGTIFWLSEQQGGEPQTPAVVESGQKAETTVPISLGDLSPDLRRVEQYYVTNINLELSNLQISDNNKAMVDGFMEQLASLDEEYKSLQQELSEMGPNDQTISALIKNLQLRLQLLQSLKNKLKNLKTSEHETNASFEV